MPSVCSPIPTTSGEAALAADGRANSTVAANAAQSRRRTGLRTP